MAKNKLFFTPPHVIAAGKGSRDLAAKRAAPDNQWRRENPWRKLRAVFLARNPHCIICEEAGRKTPAKVVDHIRPVSMGGERYAWNNLQAMCVSCHNRKTGREVQARGRTGRRRE